MAAKTIDVPSALARAGGKVEYDYLPVADLKIDETYQRPLVHEKVKQIAQAFHPDAAGLLVVSHRADGSFYVADGQHRLAAMRRLGHEYAACQVFRNLLIRDEARIFAACNSVRATPAHRVIFLAMALAGDTACQQIIAILADYGVSVATAATGSNYRKSGRYVYCTSALLKTFREHGELGLRWVLDVIDGAWHDAYNRYDEGVLRGVARFYQAYGTRINQKDLIEKLSKASLGELIRKVHALSEAFGGDRASNFARAVLEQFNRGRHNKLPDRLGLVNMREQFEAEQRQLASSRHVQKRIVDNGSSVPRLAAPGASAADEWDAEFAENRG